MSLVAFMQGESGRIILRYDTARILIHIFSDFMIMDKTVQLAKQNGVHVGAHPSLPDRQGFGRREMKMDPVSSKTVPQLGELVS